MSARPKPIEDPGQPETSSSSNPIEVTSSGWPELRGWAEHLDDLLKARVATENRARFFPYPEIFAEHIERIVEAEHKCALSLRRCYQRSVPAGIREWQEKHPGIGEHLVARLLGHLGHPVHAEPKHWERIGEKRVLVADAPRDRTVSALWQYCGHGDPARKKAKGMTAGEAFALGSPTLKMLVHLLAASCVMAKKQHPGRYGDVYDLRRIVTATRVHATPCVRCGPSGKPALAGSPWSKKHQHADAMRIVGKELLRDLWIAGQPRHDTQNHFARVPLTDTTTVEAIKPSIPTEGTPRSSSDKTKRGRASAPTKPSSRTPALALQPKPAPRIKAAPKPTGLASVTP